MPRPKEGYHDLVTRLAKPLWEALSDEAARERRSVTGQLEFILQQRYEIVIDRPRPKGRPKKKGGA